MDINIFVVKYYFIKFLHILHFLKFLKSKSTQLPRPQKGNSGVSFNDTLLNFGLRVQNTEHRLQNTEYMSLMWREPPAICFVNDIQFVEL